MYSSSLFVCCYFVCLQGRSVGSSLVRDMSDKELNSLVFGSCEVQG